MNPQKAGHKRRLHFKDVPSIPHLRMAEGLKAPSGAGLVAFSWHKHSLHIVSKSSIRGFGGITVIGPSVTTVALDWGKIIDAGIEIAKKIFGGEGGGGQNCQRVTVLTIDGQGRLTSFNTTLSCDPA